MLGWRLARLPVCRLEVQADFIRLSDHSQVLGGTLVGSGSEDRRRAIWRVTSVVGEGPGNSITGLTDLTPVDARGRCAWSAQCACFPRRYVNEGGQKPFSFSAQNAPPIKSKHGEPPRAQVSSYTHDTIRGKKLFT